MTEKSPYRCERHRAISLLLANDPKLLDFLLKPCRTELRASPERLKQAARCFSSGEQILVRAALDIWDDCGQVKLADIVFRLDQTRLEAFLLAVESLGFPSTFRHPGHRPDSAGDHVPPLTH
jgi:hypothetical protein